MPKIRGGKPSADFKKRLGSHIAAARAKAGLESQELAAKIGVKPSSMSDWEAGRKTPSLENLVAIAKHTKESVAFLLSDGFHGLASLEHLSRELGARIGANRVRLLLGMPERRLQRSLDTLIGEFMAETGDPHTFRPAAKP